MGDFMSFRRMVMPSVVQVVFALGVIAAVLVGVVGLVRGLNQHRTGEAVAGVAIIVLGPLIVRLYAEFLIVLFRINETLTDLRELAIWTAEREHEFDASDLEDA